MKNQELAAKERGWTWEWTNTAKAEEFSRDHIAHVEAKLEWDAMVLLSAATLRMICP